MSVTRPPKRSPTLLPLAISIGDPLGIGPDTTLTAWSAREAESLHPFVVFGSAEDLRERARTLRMDVAVAPVRHLDEVREVFAHSLPVWDLGVEGPGASVATAIEQATAAVTSGQALALVTNPIAKKALRAIPLPYPGHTAFLGMLAERYCGVPTPRPVMMLVCDELRVVPATVHIPLSAVPRSLTADLLVETIRTTASALTLDFGIERPRIAVAGLNPHAGEDNLIGTEETTVIAPAIARLKREGLSVTGPLAADSMFHEHARSTYDVAIAMYHDQALIPLKTLAFDRGVNVTLGLPFVRTSPDHGTAYPLAGSGKARPHSLIAALKLAAALGTRRASARFEQ
jgi:4-hydroxythreonine-4-phosphate dehydrogenase